MVYETLAPGMTSALLSCWTSVGYLDSLIFPADTSIPHVFHGIGAPDEMPGVVNSGQEGGVVSSDDSDDFVVVRRDINCGRAVMSGPVLYSVAESVAQPR